MNERESLEAKKAHYMDQLWKKAEELFALRQKLKTELDNLYQRIQNKDVDGIGLHAEELLRGLEVKYREAEEEIEEIRLFESELQKAIEAVDAGNIDEQALTALVGKEDGPRLSRRKQRILQERQRTGVDPRSGDIVGDPYGFKIDTYIMKNVGPGSSRITTGHHTKGIKGNIKSVRGDFKDVAGEFYRSTQDTHGGKAKYGKSGTQYVSKTGKNIRKR